MRRLAIFLLLVVLGSPPLALGQEVLFQLGARSIVVAHPSQFWEYIAGTVRYQGPVFSPENPNWKPPHSYQGIPLLSVLQALGPLQEGDLVWVIAVDGYAKVLPLPVLLGETPLGTPILAFSQDGVEVPEWEGGPQLVFLAPDGEVSNEDQLAALGEYAHYFRGHPSATGLQVRNVTWVVVNWDQDFSRLPQVGLASPEARLTVATPAGETSYTLPELETAFAALTYPGTYITSGGNEVTRVYTGIPLVDLLGNWPPEATLEVVAADGYRMRYRYGDLADEEGTWVLAFKADGQYLPLDPGYFRLVKVGPQNPRFAGAASAQMVVRLEIGGEYQEYFLRLSGVQERTFSRWELESGVACPYHASTVWVTRRGSTSSYTGLPLWRLLGYVDDEVSPPPEAGIFYQEGHFNWELAQAGYRVRIVAADGYWQEIPVSYLAGDDRYIIALKRDGEFLTPEEGGPLMFVWDDEAPAPEGLRRVKWVVEVILIWD